MKHVGMYAVLMQNSIQRTTWKQFGFLKTDEQINVIFAVMLYIMEQSLKEENCTMDDIGAYIDTINVQHFEKNMTYEECRRLGDFIVNVILSNEGKVMYFDGFDFESNAYHIMHISYVANKIVYIDQELKRTSYYLTDDGYNLLLSTLEIENNMKLTIHEMIFQMHLEKQSYDKAVDEIKNVFNLMRIQLQKIQEAVGKIRRNALNYSVKDYEENKNFFMITKKGIAKKTHIMEYSNVRKNGLAAINLKDDDELIEVKITDENTEIFLVTKQGMCIRFRETDVRATGRNSMGVIGMNLSDDDEIVGMQLDHQGDSLLIVSENGMGKRTYLEEFTVQKRGGKGVKCYKITEKTGYVVGVKAVTDSNEIMMITTGGVIIQLRMDDISTLGRITSGVKMINLDEGVKVAQIAKVREKVSNGDQEFENLDDAMETIPDEEKYPVQDEDEEITLPKEEEDE